MANRASIVEVQVLVEAAKAKAGLDSVAQQTDSLTDKLTKHLPALAIGAGLTALASDAVSAASKAQQAAGSIDAVFKSSAATVHAYASTSASDIGLAAGAYEELAAVIGSQFKNAGVALDELAPKTDKLIGLGADLAAQFGGSTADAVAALSSLLRGERDPIERYGVSITAAAVQAEVLSLGLDTSTEAAKRAAQQQATLSLLYDQTADAQGASAREADSYAGAQARAAAASEDAEAAVGQALLPVLTQLYEVGADLAPTIAAIAGPIAELAASFAGLPVPVLATVAALGGLVLLRNPIAKVVESYGKFSAEVAENRIAAAAAGGELTKLQGGLVGVAGKAAGAGTALLNAFGGPVGIALAAFIGLATQVPDLMTKITDGVSDWDLGGAFQPSTELGDMITEQKVLAEATDEAAKKAADLAAAQAQYADSAAVTGAALAATVEEVQGASTAYATAAQASYDAAKAQQEQAAASTGLQQALIATGGAAKVASDAADYLTVVLDKLDGRNATLDDSTAAWQASLLGMTDALKASAEAGGYSVDALANWDVAALTSTQAGQDLYAQLTDQTGAYGDLLASTYSAAAATGDMTKAQDDTRKAADDARAAFIAQHDSMGLTEAQAVTLADKLGIVEGVKLTDKEFDVLAEDKQAQDALAATQAYELNQKTLDVKADTTKADQALHAAETAYYQATLHLVLDQRGLGMDRAGGTVPGPGDPPRAAGVAGLAGVDPDDPAGLGVAGLAGPVGTPTPVVDLGTVTTGVGWIQVNNITVNGALDADSVARQVDGLLTSRARRTGVVLAR